MYFEACVRTNAEEEGGFARTNLAKELTFFEKVKAKLRSREAYQDFLKCLNLYAQEVISKSELTHLVHDLIGRYSDLAVRLQLLIFAFHSRLVLHFMATASSQSRAWPYKADACMPCCILGTTSTSDG